MNLRRMTLTVLVAISLLLGATPFLATAGPLQLYELTLTTPTNAAQGTSAATVPLYGWVERVRVDHVTANTTDVTVARVPAQTTLAAETLYSDATQAVDRNLIPSELVAFSDGVLNTNVAVRPCFAGETLRVALTNCTGVSATVRVEIVVEKADALPQ